MIDLKLVFKNFFETGRISDDSLRKFTQDHLARLDANNDSGMYSHILHPTKALFDNFGQAIDDEDNTFTTQQGTTINVDKTIDEFKKNVSRYEGMVRAIFGADSLEYQEFFPSGLTEYSTLTKSNVDILMDRMMNKSVKYERDLGSTMKQIFTTIHDNYIVARTTQLTTIGKTTVRKTATSNARKALELQLSKNILLVALEFIGQPDMVNDFFDQSIVRPKQSKSDGSLAETIEPDAVANIESRGLLANTEVHIANTGDTTLHIGLYDTETAVDTATGVQLAPKRSYSFKASDIGDVNYPYFNVKNLSATTNGSYEVLLL